MALALAINHAVREPNEWFDDPDELERLSRALDAVDEKGDIVTEAARLAFRVASAQPFTEGNKRTALLLARWLLDHNGEDGSRVLPNNDLAFADLLVKAASGLDVEREMVNLLESRH